MVKVGKRATKKVRRQGNVSRLKSLILTDTAEKARTIKKLLGRQYTIMSSEGFLRDLPKTRLNIDVENNFEPSYITVRGKGKLLEQIRKESLTARRIYAVTDEDQQGEMIALHYCELFGINSTSNFRLTLNEITKNSLKEGLQNARGINMDLVNEYEARRDINRLFTYNLQPILWNKIYRGLSINLSQAMILRIICEQEKKLQPLSDRMSVDELKEEWNAPLTWKNLQLIAVRELNFHIGAISILSRQLYEGLNLDSICTGLITYYKSDNIVPSSEERSPENLKDFLPLNNLKLYNLIWKHANKEDVELSVQKPMIRYNDYLLMRELETRGIPWIDTFSASICSMIKRKYIEATNEGYKPTKLGLEIMDIIKDNFSTIINEKFINKTELQITESVANKMSAVDTFYKQFSNVLTKALDKLGDDLTPKEPPVIESDEICEKCGKKMLIRRSRYGQFLACSGYPECKNTKPYVEYVEEKCPKCGGRLMKRKWNKGKVFYSCEKFPDCDFSTWDEPQNKTCEICGSALFLHRFKDRAPMLYCGNKDCSSRQNHPINKIIERQLSKQEEKKQKKSQKTAKEEVQKQN